MAYPRSSFLEMPPDYERLAPFVDPAMARVPAHADTHQDAQRVEAGGDEVVVELRHRSEQGVGVDVKDSGVATGRAVQPHLTRKLAGEAQPGAEATDWPLMHLAERSLAQVREGMWAVVNEQGGTAPLAKLADPRWQLAGKTGSAQVRRVSREQRENTNFDSSKLPWEYRPHALFVCYAPYDAPRYAVSVVVEHGNAGAAMAGPIARDIMTDTLQRDPANRAEPPPQQVAVKT